MNKITVPKITVVTPNFNQGDFIMRTIESVISQNYPNLEYIIIDGGSTDRSVSIIEKYKEHLHYWVSEKDAGMYDAINKGFSKSSGEIMCWINSDDVLWEGALQYVAALLIKYPEVKWLQGYPSVIDENGNLLFQRDPVASKNHFYNFKFRKDFSFIQQESTFWRRELWEKAGGKLDTSYSLAADFELWLRFFRFEDMYCSKRQLAAFRKRKGQKSSDAGKYLEEANNAVNDHLKKIPFKDSMALKFLKIKESKSASETIKWVDL